MPTRRDAISEVIERWRAGEQPDANAVLRAHPELAGQKSLVLDLVYEEYCLRSAAGETLNSSTFCDRFPNYQHSLQRVLALHDYLGQDQSFASLAGTIAWPGPGDELLGFVIQEELGRGAMARVFLATQPALGNRLVALKLSAGRSSEAAILGKLKHPNIVPIFSVEEDPASGLTAICMEFLGSSTLCDVLDQAFVLGQTPLRADAIRAAVRDSRVSAPQRAVIHERSWRSDNYTDWIVNIGAQLAGALAFAHSKGVLHRDLKPSNVLITPSGSPLLLDFNLSFDPQLDDLRFGGTLPYAAPEQLRAIFGQRRDGAEAVDQRSDIFALGALLYQMLTGALPYGDGTEADSSRSAAEAILSRQAAGAKPLYERMPAAGRAIAAVIGECLEFDPAKRPQSAGELAKRLAGCLSVRNRALRWSGRHRLTTVCAAAASVVLLLCGAWGLATRDPYPIRQFKAGVSSFNGHDFDDAILHFDNALAVNPTDAKALFARGQARQQLGNFLMASKDYDGAEAVSSAGVVRACDAYCLALRREHRAAVLRNQEALSAGFAPPEVYNNLGAGMLQLGHEPDALRNLAHAIHLNDSIQAPHYNCGRAELQQVINHQGSVERGIAEFKRALEIGPPSPELYFNLARIYAVAAATRQDRTAVVRNLRSAIDEGLAFPLIEADPLLAPYAEDPYLHGLKAAPPRSRRHPQPVLFLAPPCPSLDSMP